MSGTIESSRPLSDKRIAQLEGAFSRTMDQTVTLTNAVVCDLIGGIKVTLNGKIYDGSIKKQLDIIERLLVPGIGR